MDKIFWQQVRDNGYDFKLVHSMYQDSVKALAKAEVVAKTLTATVYKELIGEKYVA